MPKYKVTAHFVDGGSVEAIVSEKQSLLLSKFNEKEDIFIELEGKIINKARVNYLEIKEQKAEVVRTDLVRMNLNND